MTREDKTRDYNYNNNYNKKRSLKKAKRMRRARRIRACLRVFALLIICQLLLFGMTAASAQRQEAKINLKLTDTAVIQGEEMPEIRAEIEAEGDIKTVLDEESGYTAEDLLDELGKGSGYVIVCDADTMTEGEYPMHIQLEDRIRNSLKKEWVGIVSMQTRDAVFTVKNPVGDWEEDRFRRYDGTYVKNDFVVSKGNTYYFGDDEKMKAGWQDIEGSRYYLDSEGILKTGWLELEGSKYYLGQDGKMRTGRQNIDGSDYYFAEDGRMVTGEVCLGLTKYVYGEDGVLQAEEEIKVDPGKPMVALTFDDGPGKRTGELLNALAEHHAHATFFMLGKNAAGHPDEIRRMKEIGCEIASHSYDHPDLSKMDAAGIRNQIDRTNQKFAEIAGQGASVIRPPYGAVSNTLRANVGMPMILWNIDTLDWKTRNAEATVNTVMGSVKDGDIVLMHDIHSESVDAAIALIPKLIAEGYQLVTVQEMAAAKGIVMEAGKTYTDF